MKNFLYEGDTLEFTAPSGGVVSGSGYKIGDTFVVSAVTVAAGVLFNGRVRGVVALPKAASVTPAQGVKLYWDDTAKNVTTTSSSNTLIGTHASAVAAGASDATIAVKLGIVA
jgi:predicted RecA/RadA family phage recombinase